MKALGSLITFVRIYFASAVPLSIRYMYVNIDVKARSHKFSLSVHNAVWFTRTSKAVVAVYVLKDLRCKQNILKHFDSCASRLGFRY